jgi:uncharacterized protein
MGFLPREERFFLFLNEQVRLVSRAANLLPEGFAAGPAGFAQATRGIAELETKSNQAVQDIFDRLTKTFITPLDAEDLHGIAARLDNVMDCIEGAAERASAYGLRTFHPDLAASATLVAQCAEKLVDATEALSNKRPVIPACVEIFRLEHESDRLTRAAIAKLFAGGSEGGTLEVLKQKDLLEVLERAADHCQGVAVMLQTIVVKNS